MPMFLKLFFRSFAKRKGSFIITVFSLSVSLACYIFASGFLWDEISYDKSHEHFEDLYRITTHVKNPGEEISTAFTGFPLGPELKNSFPEIEQSTRLLRHEQVRVKTENENFNEPGFYSADGYVTSVLTVPFIAGDSKSALLTPFSVVLSERLAKKYFNSRDCLGRTLKLNDQTYEVKGVMKNLPDNLDMKFDALMSFENPAANDWFDMQYYTYFLLKKNTVMNKELFERKLATISERHYNESFRTNKQEMTYTLNVQPMKEIHFSSQLFGDTSKGSISSFIIITGLGILILVVAMVNYVTLSVASSAHRLKEIGVKKVHGAGTLKIIQQFIGESFFTVLLSTFAAILILTTSLPWFNSLTGKTFEFGSLFKPSLILILVCVILVITLLAGVYPAVVIRKLSPASMFGDQKSALKKNFILNGLLFIQFTFSIGSAFSASIIYSQVDHLLTMDLKFDKEHVVVVNLPYDSSHRQQARILRNDLVSTNAVIAAAIGSYSVPGGGFATVGLTMEQDGKMVDKIFNIYQVDENFLNVLAIKLLAGKKFEVGDYKRKCLINMEAVKSMGCSSDLQNCIGRIIKLEDVTYEVQGVVDNFHYSSLHARVEPLIIFYNIENPYELLVRVSGMDIGFIHTAWQKHFSEYPFDYTHLDQILLKQYRQESVTKNLMLGLSIISIILSCFGLYAVATNLLTNRVKEMAVRKVHGATNYNLFIRMSSSFVIIYGLAVIVALSVSFYYLDSWLNTFANRTTIIALDFLLTGILGLVTLLLVIGKQIYRIILISPSRALRYQ